MNTTVVSSSMTLAVKYILPAMLVGLTLPLVIFLFTGDSANYSGTIPLFVVRLMMLSFLVSIVFVWYTTLNRLMRVELDDEFVYASNYFQTLRYTYDSVENIEEWGILLFSFTTINLKAEGLFGKKIRFWTSSNWYEAKEEIMTLKPLLKN